MSAKDKDQKKKSHRKKSSTDQNDSELSEVTEVWLICAPGQDTPKATWEAVKNATAKSKKSLSTNFKFNIPDLKIDTLNVLVGLMDDFSKLDSLVESILHRVVLALHETLEEDWDKTKEHLHIFGVSVPSYIAKFQWDYSKYSVRQSMTSIGEMIAEQASTIEAELKSKMAEYNALKTAPSKRERMQGGSLMTRCLTDVVSKNDFVLNSQYLVTVLVVIPRDRYADFINKYERLADMVVPRSAKLIKEDAECGLFGVTLFRTEVDQFKLLCRKNKFFVRDFVYDEREIEKETQEQMNLAEEKKRQFEPLLKWLKVQFSETFSAWIHVKALRVYVESVLRFGLPVNFQPILIVPYKKTERWLRTTLHRLFSYLDSTADPMGTDLSTVPGITASAEYHPYVYYKINLDLLPGQGH